MKQQQSEKHQIIPEKYVCPITNQILQSPVKASDQFIYSKKSIQNWMQKHYTSPLTGKPFLNKHLQPQQQLQSQIIQYLSLNNLQNKNNISIAQDTIKQGSKKTNHSKFYTQISQYQDSQTKDTFQDQNGQNLIKKQFNIKKQQKQYQFSNHSQPLNLLRNYQYQLGQRYIGDVKNDKRNGYGILMLKNGSIYQGEFNDDQARGKGKLKYKNGNVYNGYFWDGRLNGPGILRKGNVQFEGVWENNILKKYSRIQKPNEQKIQQRDDQKMKDVNQ